MSPQRGLWGFLRRMQRRGGSLWSRSQSFRRKFFLASDRLTSWCFPSLSLNTHTVYRYTHNIDVNTHTHTHTHTVYTCIHTDTYIDTYTKYADTHTYLIHTCIYTKNNIYIYIYYTYHIPALVAD